MRKILEWLKKFNTPLCYGILCLVFGISFIALPLIERAVLDILLILAGVFVIFVGILTITDLETTDRSAAYYLSVAKTIGLIAFGLFLIVMRSVVATNLCFVLGVYTLVRAVPQLIKLVMLPATSDKSWWIKLIVAIIQILFGMWLTIYPVWPEILAGVMLILMSVDLFIRHYRSDSSGGASGGSDTIFDPHFVDRS